AEGERLSLAIADDTDPAVLAQLLRELPALCDALSHGMERLLAGDTTMFEPARRAAHTLKGAANTAGISGIARFTHALEDLLLLAEQSDTVLDPVLADALGESADTLAGMVDAAAGLGAAPANMAGVYRALLEWMGRLPGSTGPGEEGGHAGRVAAVPASLELAAAAPQEVPASDGATDADIAGSAAGAAASPREPVAAVGDDPVLRVPGALVDRLVDASTEAVIAVAQVHERLEELGRIRRAIRLGAQRARDLALAAEGRKRVVEGRSGHRGATRRCGSDW